MNPHETFKQDCNREINEMGVNREIHELTIKWLRKVNTFKYSYHFSFLGRPIIQYPQDMVAIQELIWEIKPDLIIETGIAHGGSLIQSAAMLAIIDLCEAIDSGSLINPRISSRRVVGIDIDIRHHNKKAIENHPMASRISMIQGSSIDPSIVDKVKEIANSHQNIMILLDSNHTHDHVFLELKAYANLTSVGSYCVVLDTVIEQLPESASSDRPWGPKNNPYTAVVAFLKDNPNFEINKNIQDKLLATAAPYGYLKRMY